MRKELFPHDHVMKYTLIPLIPRFVTPNAVTISRYVATPFVLYFMYTGAYKTAITLFLLTAITDIIDGSLARLRNQVTEWGTIHDPIADKLLIIGSALILVVQHLHPAIAGIIIILEVVFLAHGYNNIKRGEIQSPSWYGKIKMLCQVIGVVLILIHIGYGGEIFILLSTVAFGAAILLALLNIIKYGVQLPG